MTNETNAPTITATGKELLSYFNRIERLVENKKDISEDIKEVFAEAASAGFDVKAMKKILKIRGMDPDEIAELESIMEMYMSAMGMTK